MRLTILHYKPDKIHLSKMTLADSSLQALYSITGNSENLTFLKDQLQSSAGIIPFVGAGVSIPYGYMGWTEFLLKLAADAGCANLIQERIDSGLYEEAAQELYNRLAALAFHDSIRSHFGGSRARRKPALSVASLLPQLSRGPVITTNFDPVLERCFEAVDEPFEKIIVGSKAESFIESFTQNRRCLLKLHGTAEDRTDRILTSDEYSKYYGSLDPNSIDWTLPLPKSIQFALTHQPVLFVGCSLNKDRILQVIRYVTTGFQGLAHYAILEQPSEKENLYERRRQLSQLGIRVIWYPRGRHEYTPLLVRHLLDRVNVGRPSHDITSGSPPYSVASTRPAEGDVEVSLVYAGADDSIARALESHLKTLTQQGQLGAIHLRRIDPSGEWKNETAAHINSSQIIAYLISVDFLASEYCFHDEMRIAMERQDTGRARVLPVIVRPALWKSYAFGKLQPAPRDGRAITLWENLDEALTNVLSSIELICEDIHATRKKATFSATARQGSYGLGDVYCKSGTPTITFVEPEHFGSLTLALEHRGRGMIIEGPSGIGKTTAIKKAVEQVKSLKRAKHIKVLSARIEHDRDHISKLVDNHVGTVIIDDFHRLDSTLQAKVTDYLKYLADCELPEKKLILVGIPRTHRRLAELSFDVTTRVDVFEFGKVSDDSVHLMIERGEAALNVQFERKADIIRAASGSLNVAQMLCYEMAAMEGIRNTEPITKRLRCDLDGAVARVVGNLEGKFEHIIMSFVGLGSRLNMVTLELLKEASASDKGFVALHELEQRRPDLAEGVSRLMQGPDFTSFYNKFPQADRMLLLDRDAGVFVIDDPQLVFYIRQLPSTRWIKHAGINGATRNRVVVLYDKSDERSFARLSVHLSTLDKHEPVDIWSTDLSALSGWRERLTNSLEAARAIIFLVSDELLSSSVLSMPFVHELLEQGKSAGAVILPILVRTTSCTDISGVLPFKPVNASNRAVATLDEGSQERLWANIAGRVGALVAADISSTLVGPQG